MRRNTIVVIVILVVACVAVLAFPYLSEYTEARKADAIENDVQILVTWKERISFGRTYQSRYYLIFGELEDGTPCVLRNADSALRNKYNGSDIYQQIDIGKVYTFFTTGERNAKKGAVPEHH